jgi:hypothetical protein
MVIFVQACFPQMAIFVQACLPQMAIFPGAVIGAMDLVQAGLTWMRAEIPRNA